MTYLALHSGRTFCAWRLSVWRPVLGRCTLQMHVSYGDIARRVNLQANRIPIDVENLDGDCVTDFD